MLLIQCMKLEKSGPFYSVGTRFYINIYYEVKTALL